MIIVEIQISTAGTTYLAFPAPNAGIPCEWIQVNDWMTSETFIKN